MSDAVKTENGGKLRLGASSLASAGAGALLMALLQDYPAVMAKALDWGVGFVILAGVAFFINRAVPPFLASQQEIAHNLGRLSNSIQERFRAEDDVRMACRALSGDVERVSRRMEERFDALDKRISEPRPSGSGGAAR